MYEALILTWHTPAQSIDVDAAPYIFMQLSFLSFQAQGIFSWWFHCVGSVSQTKYVLSWEVRTASAMTCEPITARFPSSCQAQSSSASQSTSKVSDKRQLGLHKCIQRPTIRLLAVMHDGTVSSNMNPRHVEALAVHD